MRIVNQYFGIGDVIFSMSAIRSLGDKIIWPVMTDYVTGLNLAYPDINFIDWKALNIDYSRRDRYSIEDADVIPLRFQDSPLSECMKLKYLYFGMDWRKWKEEAMWDRNFEKEISLYEKLNPTGEPFNLVNYRFGTDDRTNQVAAHSIQYPLPQNGLKNIMMDLQPGYSLFDWATIIELAATVRTISTSIIYLFELLEIGANEIHIYIRRPFENSHKNYEYLLSKDKPYILEL